MKPVYNNDDSFRFANDGTDVGDSTGDNGPALEESDRPPGPLSHFPSARYSRPAIIVFFACLLFTTLYGSDPYRDKLWISGNALFVHHEWWRLFTAIFTHAGSMHLLSNTLLVLIFGWMLHAYYGMFLFPIASIMVGVITNFISVSIYAPGVRLLGASGMAYGMVAIWLVCYLSHDTDRKLPMRIFRAMGFAAVMLIPATIEPRVSYLSHAVGFIAGIIIGLLLSRIMHPRIPRGPRWSHGNEKSS